MREHNPLSLRLHGTQDSDTVKVLKVQQRISEPLLRGCKPSIVYFWHTRGNLGSGIGRVWHGDLAW